MGEMIIPGTYIDVRAEGLISAGGVATGIVGIVGTARSGPVGTAVTLGSYAEAREIYGLPDDYALPEDGSNPLTLTRAIQLAYANGATNVVAVRVASNNASEATYALKDASDNTVATLAAKTPGTWGNDLRIIVENTTAPAMITGEQHTSVFSALKYAHVRPGPRNRIQVLRGDTRRVDTFDIVYRFIARDETVQKNVSDVYQLANPSVSPQAAINSILVLNASGTPVRAYGANPPDGVTAGTIIYSASEAPALNEVRVNPAGELAFEATQVPAAGDTVIATYAVDHPEPLAGQVRVTVWNGDLDFAPGEAPRAVQGDVLTANYAVEAADCVQVTLQLNQVEESYVVPDGHRLEAVTALSSLVTVTASATHGANKPATGISAFFGTGSNIGGSNGADADQDAYAEGLEAISNRIVNIVVLAGQNDKAMGSVLLGHLKTTAETDFERIGVIGASGTKVEDFLGHNMANERLILVAPGIKNPDNSTLPPAYTAAAVAGLIASLPVQASLTNKPINVPGLAIEANRGQQMQLIQRNVLTLVSKSGYRVLKGVTTAGIGEPFSAIPTRRIVDYAKYGVRSAANPYLGRLNNSRVRSAMKATLDAFLTGMVQDEALTGYTLSVSATRAQEIAGQVQVAMTLQPTFSIEFIRVVMTLQ